ncbi:MAG: FAD:protein FMN transferase [Clostridiales bacterium]|nr:FAD:protein FMN transferase [Clostridiales bacterium]
MKRKIVSALCICLGVFLIAGTTIYDAVKNNRETDKTDVLMGTIVTQRIYGGNVQTAEKIADEISRLENELISWRVPTSATGILNEKLSVENEELGEYINVCNQLSQLSGGKFDITCGKLTQLWGIGTPQAKVPEQSEIDSALQSVDYKKITTDDGKITIGEGQSVDLGAVGKGIACDKALFVLKQNKVKSAIINVGGSLLVHGEKSKGKCWKIGVRNPFSDDASSQIATLSLANCFVSTSGDYEKVFTDADGKKYHHILNALNGYPEQTDLVSVTVVTDKGILSDGLSTVCFLVGYEKSLAILEKYDAQAVFIFKDRTVKVTRGLQNNFELTDNSFSLGA